MKRGFGLCHILHEGMHVCVCDCFCSVNLPRVRTCVHARAHVDRVAWTCAPAALD